MQPIKNIKDEDFKDDDIVRVHCPKCNNNSLFRIVIYENCVRGVCRKWSTLKINENCVSLMNGSKPIVECPYCHSKNTKKISGLSKAGSVVLWGVLGAAKVSKQWHCNNCNSEF